MKDFNRRVVMLCPLCGNDQFETFDDEFDDLVYAPDDTKLCCSDCHSIYTKEELLEGNAEILENAVEEMQDEIIRELDRELKKVFG